MALKVLIIAMNGDAVVTREPKGLRRLGGELEGEEGGMKE